MRKLNLLETLLVSIAITVSIFVCLLEVSHQDGWMAITKPSNFTRMDSGLYLSIAEKGYELFSCANIPNLDPRETCGNSGWFPGYPYLVKAISSLGLPLTPTAMGVSIFATLAICVLTIAILSAAQAPILVALLIASSALVFPGAIYLYSVFPLSLAISLILASIYATQARAHTASAFLSGLAAFCYPAAAWYVAANTVCIFFQNSGLQKPRQALRPALHTFAIGALGFVAVLVIHYATVDRWDAFFLTQAKYEHHIHWPFQQIAEQFLVTHHEKPAYRHMDVMALLRVATLLAGFYIGWKKRRSLSSIDELALLQGGLAWVMPLILANPVTLANLRSGTLMLPIVIVFRHSPLILSAFLILFSLFATETASFFFLGKLP